MTITARLPYQLAMRTGSGRGLDLGQAQIRAGREPPGDSDDFRGGLEIASRQAFLAATSVVMQVRSHKFAACCDDVGTSTVQQVAVRMRASPPKHRPATAPCSTACICGVTDHVLDRLSSGGVFSDDAFMAELTARFASFWFAATTPRH
jgi:hypothetical protein